MKRILTVGLIYWVKKKLDTAINREIASSEVSMVDKLLHLPISL